MDELKVRLSRVAYRFGLRGVTRDYVGLEPVAPLLGRACAEGATLAAAERAADPPGPNDRARRRRSTPGPAQRGARLGCRLRAVSRVRLPAPTR